MPESIGQTLKKAREANRLSLEEASDRTRIPKKILLTIEDDRLEDIPSDFYAKNFVKSYARFLGATDEGPVREYLSRPHKEDKSQKVPKTRRFPTEWITKHKKHIVIFFVAVLGAFLVFFSLVQMKRLVRYISGRHGAYIDKKRKEQKSLPAVKAARAKAPVVSGREETGIVNLEMVAHSDTWIQVMGDGHLLFRGILKKKEKDVWEAKKEIRLDIGNAGGVAIRLNGKNLGPLGKRGEKKEVIVTKNGIQPQ